ncbi:MAG TPA: AbrB/MazE/SpoVT family DNA-binding domain-containing protein [Anaerolineae bacterium]|nr:AbrB/MazE/SpoVT family DNA-binding domain-containing protein [Anaerolineae bacterium]
MIRKVFKAGNSLVVSLPKESIQALGIQEGSELSLTVQPDTKEIVISLAPSSLADIDETFAQQLNDFIDQYKPALEALAK